MKLHRLVLDDFRGVEHRELVLPDAGVVVLEGANEIGKSSMLEALDMLLTEKHSSKKATVLATKPVHRDAPARVEAEISSGHYRFTYRKQWHTRPSTTLTVHAPRPEQLTGDEAHQRVQQILDETLDAGLWDALRLLQGAPLDSSTLSGSSALSAALDAAGGSTPDAPDGAQTLLAAAAARAGEFFTASGRASGRLRTCTEEAGLARIAAADAQEALDALAADAQTLADLLLARDELTAQRDESAALVGGLQAEVDVSAAVLARVERAQARFDLAEPAAAAARVAVATRRREVEDVEQRAQRVSVATVRAGVLQDARVDVETAAAAGDAASLAARTSAAQARTLAEEARDDVRRLEDTRALERGRQRLSDLEAAITDAEVAGAAVAGPGVDTAAVRRADTAADELRWAQARVESAAAQVIVEAMALEVVVDGQVVRAGRTLERRASHPIEIDLAGFASVRVLPGPDAATLADAVDVAAHRLSAVLATTGCADVEAVHAAHEQRRNAEAALALCLQRLEHLRADGSLEQVRTDVERLTVLVQAAGPGRPEAPTDVAMARDHETATRHGERAAHTIAVKTEQAATLARRRYDDLTRDIAAHEAALAAATEEAARAAHRLLDNRAQHPDGEVETAARVTAEAALLAREELDAAQAELLARGAASARTRLGAAEAEHQRIAATLGSLSKDLSAIAARLEFMGQEGRQENYDAAASALEHLERELDGLTRRAGAARLLRDTLEAHRSVSRRRYVAPFTDRLEALGAGVFGDDFRVDLDDDLRIRSRTVAGRTVPYKDLSTGAREQLAVLTRLACAALVDPVDGVPVVLDDALGHSDPRRLERLGAVFAMVSPPAQVLLLAPGPGVHSSIPGATVIRLGPEEAPVATA
ncbi:MAG: AAA family ATPase [Janthinobacterium lividum]